ncbi:MAG TPA: YfhO family protein, partial [Thermomicrobiales bacterium]|nr:YfhO family protein [Thermomicrobiales bacterium]
NLAGGNYENLEQAHAATPYTPVVLFAHLTGDGSRHRAVALGGAAIILLLLAPVLARRRYTVPFFAGMTVVVYALTQDWTPLHPLFYVIPRFQSLHEHSPHQINAVVMIGPAMLSAAGVEGLRAWRGKRSVLPLILVPFVLLLVIAVWLSREGAFGGRPPLVSATIVTALAALIVTAPSRPYRGSLRGRVADLAPALILALAFLQPTGQELVASGFGWSQRLPLTAFEPGRVADRAVHVSLAPTDPGGAGEFLQARQAESGPFRYVGYGGLGHPDPGPWRYSYQARRLQPDVVSLLVNGRSMVLELQDIQGYNPIQLQRYVEFITALNGLRQNYHHANLLPSGTVSSLLDLLNVRYILVATNIPPDRADVVALTSGRPEVFRTDQVAIYENTTALPRAWIVHDARSVGRGDALPILTSGEIDPRQTALVEGSLQSIAPPFDPAADDARVTRYEADAIDIGTRTDAPGLLVVSEVYSSGWKAYVDGEKVEILPTNHALRGIPIPAGQHAVALRYQPASLQAGLLLTGISAPAMLVVFLASGWRHLSHRRILHVLRPAERAACRVAAPAARRQECDVGA